jgi:lysophospholipase L1-like esterase
MPLEHGSDPTSLGAVFPPDVHPSRGRRRIGLVAALSVVLAAGAGLVVDRSEASPGRVGAGVHWVGTWAASPQLTEAWNLPPAPGFADTTLRQVVHVSVGGRTLRVRFSNAFGDSDLTLLSAGVARSAGGSAIVAATDRALTFRGRPSVAIPAGAPMVSDPLEFELPPLSEVTVTVHVRGAPSGVTGHPGSRTTSYLQAGESVSAADLPDAKHVDHWYFLSGIDVVAPPGAAVVSVLGDSITDGRGSTTDGNDRWPDNLARRLQATKATAHVAVVNHGIGGNRLLRDGLGPNALARLDRDIVAQPGVRWLIVFEGINDIGTRVSAKEKGESSATAEDIITAYEQIIVRAHAHGILVYGATLLPFEGSDGYFTPDGEADRQTVNEWIRTSGRFDAVIDFDAITRDPDRPSRLSKAVDGGDHLHPSADGYRIMADAIDLELFTQRVLIPAKPGIEDCQ